MKKWPFCMKKKNPAKRCSICGRGRDALEGKTMPGLYKGKCHACYVLDRKYREAGITHLVRTKINLQKAIHAVN